MASRDSDLVAAVCCHAGGLDPENFETGFENYQPTPIQIVHGDADMLAPFWDWIYPSYVTWGQDINGCEEETVTVDSSDLYQTYAYSDCYDNVTVKLLKIFGGGHTPFLGLNPDPIDDFPN